MSKALIVFLVLVCARLVAAESGPTVDGISPGTPMSRVIVKFGEPWYQSLHEVLWGPKEYPVRLVISEHERALIVNGTVLQFEGHTLKAGASAKEVLHLLGLPAGKLQWSDGSQDWNYPKGSRRVLVKMQRDVLLAVSVRPLHLPEKKTEDHPKASLRFLYSRRQSFRFEHSPRVLILKPIAKDMGYQIYLGPGVEDNSEIDLDLNEVTPDQALQAALPEGSGYRAIVSSDSTRKTLLVALKEKLGDSGECDMHECLFGPCPHRDW